MNEHENPAPGGPEHEGDPQVAPRADAAPDSPGAIPGSSEPGSTDPLTEHGVSATGSTEPGVSDAGPPQAGFPYGGGDQPHSGFGQQSEWSARGWPPPGYQQPGYAQPGYQQPGYEQAGHQQPGFQQAGYQPSGFQQAGYAQPGYTQPGFPTPPGGWAHGDTATFPAVPAVPAVPAEERPRRSGRLRIGVAGLVAGALIGGGAGAGWVALTDGSGSQPTASGAATQNVVIKDPTTATSATAAAAKAAPSVVTMYVANGSAAGSGSGVVLTKDGYVLTNNHVVTLEGNGIGTVRVRTADGTMYDATVVGTDPTFDVAVVKLQGAHGLTPATFADSSKVQVGDLAIAIGAPLGLSNTVTDGIISATGRAVATGSTANDETVIDAIQTDAAINPGNSGGALVNAAGAVVGINTAIASVASSSFGGQQGQSGNIGVGFAIPSNTAKRIADEIIKTGKATHAVLGVSARTAGDSSGADVGTGAQIVQVQPNSAASAAGLQPGDVITAVGDRVVTSSTELTAAIRSSTPGGHVTLTVQRGTATKKVDVTLGSTTS